MDPDIRDEVARRLVHASGSAVPLAYVANVVDWPTVQYALIAFSVVGVVLEAIRLVVGLDWVVYDRLTREYEQDNLAGYALYLFGMTVAALAFPPEVAVPAMFMLTIGDPISGLLGSDELKDVKGLQVIVVMFLVCLVLAVPFLPLVAAVGAAAAATLADGVKPVVATYVIDDNLTIPIAAGAVGFLLVTYVPF